MIHRTWLGGLTPRPRPTGTTVVRTATDFEILKAFLGPQEIVSIRCLHCGWSSYNPDDVNFRYCSHCHRFLAE